MEFVKFLFILTVLISFTSAFSQTIGLNWEFNTDGNAEGWSISAAFSDLVVAGGTLQATVSGAIPHFQGPEFLLSAADYGFVVIRLKAPGATRLTLYWKPETIFRGFAPADLPGDSSFYECAIPVYGNKSWTGNILGLSSFTVNASVGTRVEIDYIRIMRLGFNPQVKIFAPLRTIFKTNQPFPVYAVVENKGDQVGTTTATLALPPAFQITEGTAAPVLNLLPGTQDTLSWTLQCPQTGDFDLALELTRDDTVCSRQLLPVSVTDTWWRQDEFILSAWSPPGLNTAAYDYYSQANFDLVLSLPLDESTLSRVEQHQMRCLMHAGGILGENEYLRAPENKPLASLPPDRLANLNPYLDQFRNRSAVIGYYLTDEPNAYAFENLGKAVAYLREKDPTRLSFINLFPTYANEEQLGTKTYEEHVRRFIETVKPELLSYDHYHFFNGYDGKEYFKNLGIIREYANRYDIPFCNIIQAIGADFLNWRIPTPAEHRWLVYSSLAYGAKAIIWFHWDHEWGLTGSSARDRLYASIQALNQEIQILGPVLLKLKSDAVYHSLKIPTGGAPLPAGGLVQSVAPNADLVIGILSDESGRRFLLLMNKSYQDSVSTQITLAGTQTAVKIFDLASRDWQPVATEATGTGTRISAEFLPGGGRLFALTEPSGIKPPPQGMPRKMNLLRNFPNPFNTGTTIEYELVQSGPVKISVFDSLGREIAVLLDAPQTAGQHHLTWDARNVASGNYLVQLKTGDDECARKVVVVK